MHWLIKVNNGLERTPTWLLAVLLLLIYSTLYFVNIVSANSTIAEYLHSFFTEQFFIYLLVGFGAQIIDGALGMAYGISATSFLLSTGISPAAASASVHVAEVFTTGASALSHFSLRNVNKRLFKAMVLPGMLGAITGAYILTSVNPDYIKPFVSAYLFVMGIIVIRKALAKRITNRRLKRVGLLALSGGFLDAIGGGGWGPVVTSTLLSKGRDPKYTIGTVNTTEFFVTLSSAGIFTLFMGLQNIEVIAGLVIGGVVAAPFGALLVGKIKARTLMIMVGCLIIFLSLRSLLKYLPILLQ